MTAIAGSWCCSSSAAQQSRNDEATRINWRQRIHTWKHKKFQNYHIIIIITIVPGRGNKQYCGQALGFWNKNIGIIASTLGWSAQALRGIPWLWYSFVECNPTIMEPPMSLRGLRKNLRAISNPWNDTRDTVDIFTAVLESESWFKSHTVEPELGKTVYIVHK